MNRPRLPLGDYYQLLLKHALLADTAPLRADLGRSVSLVTCDSQVVLPGALFVCKGAAFRSDYLLDAVRKGAFAYVSERVYSEAVIPCIQVTDIRRAMALLADRAWGHPSGALEVIGITGTKGKTTTAYYLKSILDHWRTAQGKHATALLSTIVTDDGVERRPAKLTTPEPLDLQRHLWNAAGAEVDYLTMEVSSQALKYHRVTGVDFAATVFLNIGEDHISPVEHPDFEDYFTSKLLLFRGAKIACINRDCDHANRVAQAAGMCPKVLSFSVKDATAEIYASDITKDGSRTVFTVRTPRYTRRVSISMSGLFNVENALAAVAVAEALDVPEEFVYEGLACAVVPGRMETYVTPDGMRVVIVDYAHNGMSLEALLSSVRQEYPGRQVTVLFGCTGGKGLDRREGMGNAAGKYADRVILTEDDPACETVEAICADVGRYLAAHGRGWTVVPDRPQAVAEAIRGAALPAVIVLAGKGAEQMQKRAHGPEPCVPDAMLVQQVLREYGL